MKRVAFDKYVGDEVMALFGAPIEKEDSALNAALAAEGMSAQDGAPADLIRNYFDQTTAGPGTPTVKEKLILEVNDTIEELFKLYTTSPPLVSLVAKSRYAVCALFNISRSPCN